MKAKLVKILVLFFSLLLSNLSLAGFIQAQSQPTEITSTFDIADKQAVDGDIIVFSQSQGLIRASAAYDVRLFGVLQRNPLLVYRRSDNGGDPLLRSGVVLVNVSTLNGEIKAGDYLTSSEIAGLSEKASESGYVIGTALASFSAKDGTSIDYKPTYAPNQGKKITVGKVMAAVRIEYADLSSARSANRLFSYFSAAMFRNIQDPQRFTEIFRYIASGLVVLVAFAVGFLTFTRSIPKSIEAIGRNPLAAGAIRFSIILNIVFTILIGLVGIIAAVVIVKV